MDKLTLQILSQYSAHGVKVQYEGITNLKELSEWSKREPKTHDVLGEEYQKWISERPENITGLRYSAIKEIRILKNYATIQVGSHHNYSKKVGLNEVKLCLRPLSDLTKEIEHNGERFIPIEWFEIGDDFNETVDYGRGNVKLIGLLEDMAKHNFIDLPHIQFGVVSKLIEWHFDIYGLIDKGLAVDINSLKS